MINTNNDNFTAATIRIYYKTLSIYKINKVFVICCKNASQNYAFKIWSEIMQLSYYKNTTCNYNTVLFQVLILIADETKNLEITNPQLGLVLQGFS